MLTALAAAFSDPTQVVMVFKLLMAASLGAIIGYERERMSRPAGLRTHILVAMGATVFTLLSISAFPENADPGRMAAYIVVGIGFIGAGTVIQLKDKVIGLTTAASLWITASIGVAVATGFYLLALSATVIAFMVLSIKHVEEAIREKPRRARR